MEAATEGKEGGVERSIHPLNTLVYLKIYASRHILGIYRSAAEPQPKTNFMERSRPRLRG